MGKEADEENGWIEVAGLHLPCLIPTGNRAKHLNQSFL